MIWNFTTFEVSYWTLQDLPELRNDVMVVWETLGRLHYAVRYNHPDMRRKNISLRVSYDIPSSDCVGTWIRVPEKVGQIMLIFECISQYHSIQLKNTLMTLP